MIMTIKEIYEFLIWTIFISMEIFVVAYIIWTIKRK